MAEPLSLRCIQTRLLLVVEDDVSRQYYCKELASCGAEVVVVTDIFPLSEEVARQYFHGLLLDVRAKMKAIRDNKAEVYRLTARLPTAQLQYDVNSGSVRVFYPGQGTEKSLAHFVITHCRRCQPQKLRSFSRKPAYLPVLVWMGEAKKEPRRLVTKDISPGGCFLVSYQRWHLGKKVKLLFPGNKELGTILAEVANVVIWGNGRELPGVGVEFIGLAPQQEEVLHQFCATL
jgi:hypothetical protein